MTAPLPCTVVLARTDTPGIEALKPKAWLSPRELQRWQRLKRPSSRCQLLLGRYLLRQQLGLYSCPPTELSYGPEGRPSLESPNAIPFNLSHSGNWVALSYCKSATAPVALGIDIENSARQRAFMEIAESCFSPDQQRRLLNLAAVQRQQLFYRYWVLREACAKASGKGLLAHALLRLTPADYHLIRFDQQMLMALTSPGHRICPNYQLLQKIEPAANNARLTHLDYQCLDKIEPYE